MKNRLAKVKGEIYMYIRSGKKKKKITYYQAITRKRFRGRKTFFCCFSKHKYYLRGGRKKKEMRKTSAKNSYTGRKIPKLKEV